MARNTTEATGRAGSPGYRPAPRPPGACSPAAPIPRPISMRAVVFPALSPVAFRPAAFGLAAFGVVASGPAGFGRVRLTLRGLRPFLAPATVQVARHGSLAP